MLTHAEIYANVIKARPECAVGPRTVRGTSLFWRGPIDEDGRKRDPREIGWTVGDDGFDAVLCGGDEAPLALALITDHCTEMLPEGRYLGKTVYGKWRVWSTSYGELDSDQPEFPTRFHALAEFHVPGSTKEKA